MYYHFCLLHYVILLIKNLVIFTVPLPCLVYYRGQRYLTRGFCYGGRSRGMRWITGRVPMEACDFSVMACWLLLDLHVGVGIFLQVCCVLLKHFSVRLLLGDCFCDIITCHYCSFCVCTTSTLFMCFA